MVSVISLATEARQRYTWQLAKQYRSFDSIEFLDRSVAAFLSVHGAKLSRGTLNVLEHLRRHSVKILGVSFGKVKYIAETASVSEPTVQRAMQLLESLGIVKRIPTITAQGGQGVNLVVIQPFQAPAEYGDDTPDDAPPRADQPRRHKASQSISANRNVLKHKNSIDIDLYQRFNRKWESPSFRESNLHKYGLEHIILPEPIREQVYVHMVANLDEDDFQHVPRRSIHTAIMRSCNKFLEFYRRGHRITSYGAFFLAVFKDHLERVSVAS